MSFDEHQLIDQFISGDAEAFGLLYDRYAHRVFGFASSLEANPSDAEDLVQEVFLAAYAGRHQFRRDSKLLTWLLGITWRRWRDRQRRRLPETISLSERLGENGSTDRFHNPPAGSPIRLTDLTHGPEGHVIMSLTLNAALAQLEPVYREAVLLVVSQGLTYREAAEVLGEPIGTVKWRVSQSMHRLARILTAVEEEFHEMQERPEPCRISGTG